MSLTDPKDKLELALMGQSALLAYLTALKKGLCYAVQGDTRKEFQALLLTAKRACSHEGLVPHRYDDGVGRCSACDTWVEADGSPCRVP